MSVTKQQMAFLLAQQDDTVLAGNQSYDSDVSVVGNLAVGDYFDITAASGNIAVNTNKFTVAGSSGNTVIAGTASVAGALTASAALTVGTTLGVTGNVAINTNKFTVAASSGNTLVAGTLAVTGDVAVNTNKLTVSASTGNTAIAGKVSLSGLSTYANNAAALSGGLVANDLYIVTSTNAIAIVVAA